MIGDPIKYTTSEYPGESFEIEFLQDFADDLGISLDEYKEKFGVVEFKDEEEPPEEIDPYKRLGIDVDIDIEDAKTTAAVPGATAVTEQASALDAAAGEDKASLSLESQLANLRSEYKKEIEKKPAGTTGFSQKSFDFKKAEKELINKIKAYNENPDNIDFGKPETVINQNEDAIKAALSRDFPYLQAVDGTIGNAIKVQLANGEFKEIDLKPIFSGQRKQAIEIIKEINQTKKLSKDLEIIQLNMNKLAGNIKETGSVNAVNALLKNNTPYQIVKNESSVGSTVPGVNVTPTTYTFLKDGKPVGTMDIDKVDDFLRDNITETEFNSMRSTSTDAIKTMASLQRAYIEEESKIIEVKPYTKIKYYKKDFSKDALDVMQSLGFSTEDKAIVEDYIKQTQSQKGEYVPSTIPGMGRRQNISPNEIIKQLTSLSGLPEDLKNRLIEKGFIDNMKEAVTKGISNFALEEAKKGAKTLLQDSLSDIDQDYLLDLANHYNKGELDSRKLIDVTKLGGLTGSDTKELLKIAGSIKGTDVVLRTRKFEEDNKNAVKAWEDFYNPKFETLQKEIVNTIKKLPPSISVEFTETPSGPLFKVDSTKDLGNVENKRVNNLINELTSLQSAFHNLGFDAKRSKDKILNNYDAFYSQLSDFTKNDYIINEANKEYGLLNLVVKDTNDAFSALFLTIPTLFESEYAIRKQKQLNDKNNYYKEMVGPELSLEYVTRTLGQQSANITMAIGIAGLGSIPALGLSSSAVGNAIGVSFGFSSGTQTFRDLNVQVDAYEEAVLMEAKYKKAFEAGKISEYDYDIAMKDINTTKAMGKLTDNQILSASVANGVIEGVFTKYIGTASNSIALVKNFTQVDKASIAKNLFTSNPNKFYEFIVRPLVTRTGLEVVEEELIFGSQQFFTEAGILGRGIDRDKFFKGANDTFWATVVTAGLSQSTGITYAGMNTYGLTKKYEKAINKSSFALTDLSRSIQNLSDSKTDQDMKKILLLQYQEELKAMGLAVDSNSVDLLNISKENKDGDSDLKRLIGAQLVKQDYLRSLGIEGGTKAEQDSALQTYKNTLNEGQLKNLNNTLSALDNEINNIKEKASKASNYDVAKKALGSIYTVYDLEFRANKDTEYEAANTQGKLVKIINAVREEMRLQNIENAKSNPYIVEQVEGKGYMPGGLTTKAKDKLYEHFGTQMALQKGRGFSTQLNINRQADILFGKDLKSVNVVGYKTDDELRARLKAVGLKPGSPDFMEAFNKLKQGKAFGLVFGKTIITQNEEAMNADLEKGEVRAGTVILHELNHIIDDAQMKSPESKKKYFDNLFVAASTSSNKALVNIHDQTVKLMNQIYGDKEGDNKLKWQDEYTKYLQEQLYAYEDFVQIETEDSFLTRIFNSTNPANLNTPEKALNYLAANNAAFRKGKISSSTAAAVEKFEGTNNIKESGRDINDLARDYKALPVDQRASFLLDTDFYRQYKNTSLAAMGFNINKGDIATEQAEGFAVDAFDRVIRTYKPEDNRSFTNWIYSTVGREGRAKIGEEIERKKGLVRQSQAQEQTRLVAKETAEDAVSLEERKKSEGKGKSLVDPRKLPGVPANIDNLVEVNKNEIVINPESRSYTTDFRSISDQYGSKIAGEIYGINPSKLKKGADLTYGQNKIVDGRKVSSEAERIQSDYVNVQDAKKLISLFPEFNISTPTAVTTEQGQETKVDKDVQGRALGIAPSVQNYFYENYTDPRALNKETKKDAITNPKGRSKGSTSQTQVRRLKPEFRGTISNETIKKLQNDLGITAKGEFNVPPKGKARTEFGRLLIGLANLKGAIVANTVVDQKIQSLIKKGKIKSVRTPEQITASTRAGRSKIQFSEKALSEQLKTAANTSSGVLSSKSKGYMKAKTVSELNDLGFKTVADIKNIYNLPLKKDDKNKALKRGYSFAGLSLNEFAETPLVVGLNKFINDFPQYRDILRKSMTGSLQKGSMISTGVFDQVSPRLEVKIPFVLSRQQYKKIGKVPNVGMQDSNWIRKVDEDPKKYAGDQYSKLKGLENFWFDVETFLNTKGNENFDIVFDQLLADGQNNMNSLIRISAPILYTLTDSNGNYIFNEKIREEHNFPANQVGSLFLWAAKNGKVKEAAQVVSAAYMQGPLTIDDDNKVNKDYSKTMPDIFWNKIVPRILKGELVIPEGFASVIRLTESGVNLDSYTLIDEKKTFSEWLFGTNGLKLADQKRFTTEFLAEGRSLQDIKTEAKILVDAQEKVDQVYKKDSKKVNTINRITDEAMSNARNSIKYSEKRRGISVFDFDDTLAQSNSNVLYTMPDGTTGSLTAGEFALEASGLTNLGAEFDFSEFNEVKDGRKGPLADVAIKRQGKFGSQDIFVLTARPQSAAINIKKFLDEIGLNIPLANITGLENGTAEAKADWMIEKYADGYNDFYFADDAFKNVEAVRNVFDVLDVKSDVQQARVKFSSKLDTDFNLMIERNKGVKAEARYSDVLARRMGKNQDRFQFFLPPSAEDFRGLTMYTFAGKGKQGEADQKFFDKALIKPYMAGVNAMKISQQAIKNDYKALVREFPSVRKKLNKKLAGTKYTTDEAIRIFLWDKSGFEIPGLSKTDQKQIVSLIKDDANLLGFAEGVEVMTRKETYVAPTEFWDGSTIIGDLNRLAREVNRSEYLKEFNDNVDAIFNDKNYNKIEALYGFRTVEALKDIIYRMKTGSNRAAGGGRIVNAWNDWVNNSVGAIMFFNRRSALLQMLSAGNFVNWSDNNPLKAGLAFANQLQYWKDVAFLFNSDKLKARRSGLQSDINESEIAAAARKGGAEGALSYLLKIGFTPTQLADSFAISTGGATFYRNRINTYKNQGFTQGEAEVKAFSDFSAISDETQQSADPMLISGQQAGVLGRLVLAFQNTPMQYTRLMKKAGQDLINRRGDDKTNISKILYYGFIQNLIFSTLQNALFAMLPGADEEDPSKMTLKERVAYEERQEKIKDNKISRVGNNMIDTILRGSGLGGAVISTLKNIIREYNSRADMSMLSKSRANADMLIALTSISPPISSKVRKVNNALDIEEFDKDVIAERGYSVMIDDKFQLSPSYNMLGNISSAFLNLPLDRVFDEVNSITEALDDRNTSIQRIALGLGWKTWDVGTTVEEHELIKTTAKEKRKESGIQKGKVTRALTKNYKAQVVTNLKEKYPDNWTTILREYILESGYKNINSLKIDDYVLLSKEYQVPIKPVDSLKISDINKKKVIKVKVDEYK